MAAPLDAHQQKTVLEALRSLTEAFPGLSARQIIEGPLARQALGDLPPWSTLDSHKLTDVMTANRGAFVLCHFKDGAGETQLVMGARPKEQDSLDTLYNASGGGFANQTFTDATQFHPASKEGEQPAQTAVRELREEIRNDKGEAVLDLDPVRLTLISAGVDNRALAKGGHPTDWCGYSVELTPEEVKAITAHCDRIARDPAYMAACREASGGETAFVKIISLADAAKIPVTSFAHPHESTVIAGLAAQNGAGLSRKSARGQAPGC